MKILTVLFFAFIILTGWLRVHAEQQSKVPQSILKKAQVEGIVSVIVKLNVPWQPERTLTQEAKLQQRKAIVTVVNELQAELAGTEHKIKRQYETIAALALVVGLDALNVLELSPRVVSVAEDGGGRVGILPE